jgi:hypothetical protein
MPDHDLMTATVIVSAVVLMMCAIMFVRAMTHDVCSRCGRKVRTRTIDYLGRCTSCRLELWISNTYR